MNCEVNAGEISIDQTLSLLDTTFKSVAEGVANDTYMFWIGSGISFGRVDGLTQIVTRIVEFLRAKIDHSNKACKFKKALAEALSLATFQLEAHPNIDLSKPFSEWAECNQITQVLVSNYSRLLDIEVDGEPEDYLLWSGIDIRATFANPDIPPDVEHLCLAILVEEECASEMASANWDGLIENANRELTQGKPSISVYVAREDLRQRSIKGALYKFHGCAPSAVTDENKYRPHLIGRQSQIHDWAARDENSVVVSQLENLIATKPTFMVGLSAQDANIQALFSRAAKKMCWEWPGDRPSYVFSENELGIDQKIMLKIVYGDQYQAIDKTDLWDKSRIKAYAKPLLFALVLHVLCSKLRRLAHLKAEKFSEGDIQIIEAGIITLRDIIASHANEQKLPVLRKLIETSGAIIGLFRDGNPGSAPRRYEPIIPAPLDQLEFDPNLSASGLQEAALAIAILGHGVRNEIWTVKLCEPSQSKNFVMEISSAIGTATLQLISNNEVGIRLISDESFEEGDKSVAIYSTEIAPINRRSPHSQHGRTGQSSNREVSIHRILEDSESFDDLLQQFREQVAL